MEIWKDVVGYEGLYEVSSVGRVNNVCKSVIVPSFRYSDGYLAVNLYKERNRKMRSIHSLIAEAFINNSYRDKRLVVNHINFIRDDNRLENLEVVTQRENSNQKHLPSTSKYTGVCWKKDANMWVSSISINGKPKKLGYFKDEYEAHLYYENALVCVKEDRIDDIRVKRRFRKDRSVCFHKGINKWQTYAFLYGSRKYLGCHRTKEEAHSVVEKYLCLNK